MSMEYNGLRDPNIRAMIDELKREDLVNSKNAEQQILNGIKSERLKTETQKQKFINELTNGSGEDLKNNLWGVKKIEHPWYVRWYRAVTNKIKTFFTQF